LPGRFKYFKKAYGKLYHYKVIQTEETPIALKNLILVVYLKTYAY